ncbi:MAG TPA: hypothetical protein VIT02_06920 [Burkholderiaceae bacterium]
MAYGTRFMIGAAMFAVAVAAQPVEAEFDQQGADCFFAENRDDPLCRDTVLAAASPPQHAVAPLQYLPAQGDGVDCFFAENREHLLCRETSIPFAARSSVP